MAQTHRSTWVGRSAGSTLQSREWGAPAQRSCGSGDKTPTHIPRPCHCHPRSKSSVLRPQAGVLLQTRSRTGRASGSPSPSLALTSLRHPRGRPASPLVAVRGAGTEAWRASCGLRCCGAAGCRLHCGLRRWRASGEVSAAREPRGGVRGRISAGAAALGQGSAVASRVASRRAPPAWAGQPLAFLIGFRNQNPSSHVRCTHLIPAELKPWSRNCEQKQ